MEYGTSHRVLLTYIRSVKYISYNDLISRFSAILDHLSIEIDQTIDQCLLDHINLINQYIGDHGFKVERRIDEATNVLHYVFVHLDMNDETSKTLSNFSINELDTIKKLIENIVEAPSFEYSIGKVNARQIIIAAQNKTSSEALAFISSLIDNGWFVITLEDRLLLSQRSITELKTYLINRYGTFDSDGKIILCKECNNIVTLGSYIPELNSGFHYRCLDIYQKTKNTIYDNSRQIGPSLSTLNI